MSIDKRSLRLLRKRLPPGYIAETHQELKRKRKSYSTSYISQVINGSRFDPFVLNALIAVAEAFEAQNALLATRARGEQQPA